MKSPEIKITLIRPSFGDPITRSGLNLIIIIDGLIT